MPSILVPGLAITLSLWHLSFFWTGKVLATIEREKSGVRIIDHHLIPWSSSSSSPSPSLSPTKSSKGESTSKGSTRVIVNWEETTTMAERLSKNTLEIGVRAAKNLDQRREVHRVYQRGKRKSGFLRRELSYGPYHRVRGELDPSSSYLLMRMSIDKKVQRMFGLPISKRGIYSWALRVYEELDSPTDEEIDSLLDEMLAQLREWEAVVAKFHYEIRDAGRGTWKIHDYRRAGEANCEPVTSLPDAPQLHVIQVFVSRLNTHRLKTVDVVYEAMARRETREDGRKGELPPLMPIKDPESFEVELKNSPCVLMRTALSKEVLSKLRKENKSRPSVYTVAVLLSPVATVPISDSPKGTERNSNNGGGAKSHKRRSSSVCSAKYSVPSMELLGEASTAIMNRVEGWESEAPTRRASAPAVPSEKPQALAKGRIGVSEIGTASMTSMESRGSESGSPETSTSSEEEEEEEESVEHSEKAIEPEVYGTRHRLISVYDYWQEDPTFAPVDPSQLLLGANEKAACGSRTPVSIINRQGTTEFERILQLFVYKHSPSSSPPPPSASHSSSSSSWLEKPETYYRLVEDSAASRDASGHRYEKIAATKKPDYVEGRHYMVLRLCSHVVAYELLEKVSLLQRSSPAAQHQHEHVGEESVPFVGLTTGEKVTAAIDEWVWRILEDEVDSLPDVEKDFAKRAKDFEKAFEETQKLNRKKKNCDPKYPEICYDKEHVKKLGALGEGGFGWVEHVKITPKKLTELGYLSGSEGEAEYRKAYGHSPIRLKNMQPSYALKFVSAKTSPTGLEYSSDSVEIYEKYKWNEVRIHRPLNYSRIVRLHFQFRLKNKLAMAMDYAQCGELFDLRNHIYSNSNETPPAISEEELITYYFPAIYDAVLYLHKSARILHRDLKLDNILLFAKGEVGISDMGLACVYGECEHIKDGAVEYMAPEWISSQAGGEDYDEQVDYWILGNIFYECLTGRKPMRVDEPDGNIDTNKTRKRILDRATKLDYSAKIWSKMPEVRKLVQALLTYDHKSKNEDKLRAKAAERAMQKFLEKIYPTHPLYGKMLHYNLIRPPLYCRMVKRIEKLKNEKHRVVYDTQYLNAYSPAPALDYYDD